MTDRNAYIILNMLSGIGPARLDALVEFCGTPSQIFECDSATLTRISGISATLAERILAWRGEIDYEGELDLAERAGVHIVTRAEEEYPSILREIHDAPICLYVRGKIPENIGHKSIAMVGTRNITTYGSMMAQHLAEAAGYAGWTVVSGLAIGVDTVAHKGLLNTPDGETVAVLGGGLARIHPQENLALAREITKRGAVISEFPMNFSPTRRSFPMRNRIISGLSLGTLVIEAGLNSGSLITASLALEQGRRVFAVPGQADRYQSNGCNALIRQGAVLVERFEHVLQEFDFLPGFETTPSLRLAESASVYNDDGDSHLDDVMAEGLSSTDAAILNVLKKGEASVDDITLKTALPASDILSSLIALEILCRVKKMPNGAYQRLR